MKKLLILTALLILSVLAVSAQDYIVWDFTNYDDAAVWVPSKSTSTEMTPSGLKMWGSGDDIHLSYKADREIILDDYKLLVIEYEGASIGGGMQFYHWTAGEAGNPRIDAPTLAGPAGEVKAHKIDLKNPPSTAKWTGKVDRFRFDPFRGSAEREITIKSIGVYKDTMTYNKLVNTAAEESIAAGEPVLLLNPSDSNMCFPTTPQNSTISYKDNYAIVTSAKGPPEGNGDPHFAVSTAFSGDNWGWMKIRLRNLSDATHFEMHFASDLTDNKVTGPTCTRFPITQSDADFVEYIIDVQATNKATTGAQSVWQGNISTVRFDCMWKGEPSGQMATGSEMYIDYIAFFRSEADAKAYTPDASTEKEEAAINTGAANPVWIFDNEEIIKSQNTAGSDITFDGGMLKMVPLTSDPIIHLSVKEPFSSAEFPIFAYRHSTNSKESILGVFYTTSTGVDLAHSYSPIPIVHDGSWSNVIVDLSDISAFPKGTWNGDITGMRIDPINGEDTNAVIYIDRLGFFRTRGEALDFLNEGRNDIDYSAPIMFKNDYQSALIPANTLFEGYKEAEFLLTSTTPAGEGADPVVVRTNADGSREIVALSYTNPHGYTTFVANKPATYTLEYNTKAYSDTSGHWGEGYINFVSNRTLFGGTSPTEFSPDMPMTRGMFVTVLGRMYGVDTAKYDGNTGYGDVPATEYYAPYIQWAKENNLMPGVTDTTFAPEEPIYRETMALVIANFADYFDFEMAGYADEMEFTDLTGVDEATVAAIKKVQKLGIINGKGEGRFDPKGLSTRAEVATVMERVIKTALGVNMAQGYDADYFKRDHIKLGAWGFQSNFGNERGMELLRDLGVNLIVGGSAVSSGASRNAVFNYADKYGMAVYANDFNANQTTLDDPNWDPKAKSSEYSHHPSFAGHYFTDEPGTDSYPVLSGLSKRYHEFYPDNVAYVNLLPMYANSAQLKKGAGAAAIEYYDPDPDLYRKYCQKWFEDFDADYICTDIYPLHGQTGKPETWTTYRDYCESINQIATVARENGKEFWCCIQTWGWSGSMRNPTEAEFRWQCYSVLSYGAKGIFLWSLNSGDEANFPSIFNKSTNDVTRPLYDDCATVMWEMRKLSDVYVQYRNLGAFTVNCSTAEPWLRMTGEYKDFHILSETKSDEPLLIGCFEKTEGAGYAFTVVNMTDIKDNKPATLKFKVANPLTVTLYDEAVPTVLEADANGYYTINLESTDGVFVTIG